MHEGHEAAVRGMVPGQLSLADDSPQNLGQPGRGGGDIVLGLILVSIESIAHCLGGNASSHLVILGRLYISTGQDDDGFPKSDLGAP